MYKKIIKSFAFFIILSFSVSYAIAEEYIDDIFKNHNFSKTLQIWEELKIDLTEIEKKLKEKYSSKIIFKWDLKWSWTKKWNIYSKIFNIDWEKEIRISIYFKEQNVEKLITTKKYNLFIYKEKFFIIIDNKNIQKENINFYISKARNNWIYIEKIFESNYKELSTKDIYKNISSKKLKKHNYIMLWWNKNFIFSVISQLNKEININKSTEKLNLVLISPFNTSVLNNYLRNFISNKDWIKSILLLPESSMSVTWFNENNITVLEKNLKSSEYEYININKNSNISEILFISKFVNNLSNEWFTTNYIYLILLIPFLFTSISIFKHLLWFSPIGIIIPVTLTLLMFQIWFIITIIILCSIIIINLLLWRLTNKYTLLYTPKISFILIINIIFIIWILNILFYYNFINLNTADSLFIIFFILISERLITIVLWKEFSEYKYNLLNTVAFAFILFFIFSIGFIQTLILAYPEIIIFLIPINFIIWKFTWLRVTEYFRFKEIIKSIEEE